MVCLFFTLFFTSAYIVERLVLKTIYMPNKEILQFLGLKSAVYNWERLHIKSGYLVAQAFGHVSNFFWQVCFIKIFGKFQWIFNFCKECYYCKICIWIRFSEGLKGSPLTKSCSIWYTAKFFLIRVVHTVNWTETERIFWKTDSVQ